MFICRRVFGDSGVFLLSAVSPPPYVRSSRSVGRLSAITVAVKALCTPPGNSGKPFAAPREVRGVALSAVT